MFNQIDCLPRLPDCNDVEQHPEHGPIVHTKNAVHEPEWAKRRRPTLWESYGE